jgi:hypothetical protein
MQFEYEVKMRDGRRVNVVGEAQVTYSCDCGGETHDHIESIDIESAVEVVNDESDSWLELEDSALEELESRVEAKLYTELAVA